MKDGPASLESFVGIFQRFLVTLMNLYPSMALLPTHPESLIRVAQTLDGGIRIGRSYYLYVYGPDIVLLL